MPTPRRHALLLAALSLLLAAAAQPNDSRDRSNGGGDAAAPPRPSFSAPMVVLLVALVAVFFFIGFFSIYIRRCGRGASTGPSIPAAALEALERRERRQRGLDPDVLASFPTMTYAEAKELRVDGGKDAALECAVCLSEFDDAEELLLLPKCSHAFHPDCIGEWLAGHVTCPVCRRSLVEPEVPAAAEANCPVEASGEQQAQEVAIDVSGEEEEVRREAVELERIGSQRRAVRSRSVARPLPRSYSAGHSPAAPRPLDGDLERFTLRLPEHVRMEMVAAGEESLRRTGVRGAGAARSARIGRSDRWPSFISRTFSSGVPFWSASRRAPDAEAGAAVPASAARSMREKTVDGSVKGSVRFDCIGGRVGAVAGDSDEEKEEEKAIVQRV